MNIPDNSGPSSGKGEGWSAPPTLEYRSAARSLKIAAGGLMVLGLFFIGMGTFMGRAWYTVYYRFPGAMTSSGIVLAVIASGSILWGTALVLCAILMRRGSRSAARAAMVMASGTGIVFLCMFFLMLARSEESFRAVCVLVAMIGPAAVFIEAWRALRAIESPLR